MAKVTHEFDLYGKHYVLETGELAKQATGAVLVKCGELGSEILEKKRVGHRKRSSGLKAPLCPKKRMVEFLR